MATKSRFNTDLQQQRGWAGKNEEKGYESQW
jgi:hypothetical protein